MLLRSLLPALALLLFCASASLASDGQFSVSDQTVCADCIAHHCVLVPETRQIKKTVYEVQEVPYCLKKLPPLFSFHRHCRDECIECDCVRYKKVLVKKEVVCCEIQTMKCEPQPCK